MTSSILETVLLFLMLDMTLQYYPQETNKGAYRLYNLDKYSFKYKWGGGGGLGPCIQA